jgi:hypothetical protein
MKANYRSTMLTVKKLRRKPKHFHNFTGLTPEQFDQLLLALEPLYEEAQEERLENPNRLRSRGAGRKFELELPERLLMSLMYFRLYITLTLLGYLFGLDTSNVSREVNGRMLGVLPQVLPVPARDEPLSLDLAALAASSSSSSSSSSGKRKRAKKIGTLEELFEKHPEFKEIFIDGTEQELPKPKDKGRRKEFYSGKRKRHTAKMQVLSTRNKLILHLSRYVPGRVSDLVLLRATGVMRQMPTEEGVVRVDKGYEGLEEEYPQVKVEKPLKARRGHPLTALEKIHNRAMSTLRMPVEHAIGRLRKYRLLAGIYRGRVERYDESALVIAGLHNYRELGKLGW